jgi:hypothetical protein
MKLAVSAMEAMNKKGEAVADMRERQVEADIKQRETLDELMQKYMAATALYESYKLQLENVKNGVGKLTLELEDLVKLFEILNEFKFLLPEDMQKNIESIIANIKGLSTDSGVDNFNKEMNDLNYRINLIGNDTN